MLSVSGVKTWRRLSTLRDLDSDVVLGINLELYLMICNRKKLLLNVIQV